MDCFALLCVPRCFMLFDHLWKPIPCLLLKQNQVLDSQKLRDLLGLQGFLMNSEVNFGAAL